jgi:hypothetical protein
MVSDAVDQLIAAAFNHLNNPEDFNLNKLEWALLGGPPRGATRLFRAVRRYLDKPTDRNRLLMQYQVERAIDACYTS